MLLQQHPPQEEEEEEEEKEEEEEVQVILHSRASGVSSKRYATSQPPTDAN